MFPAGMGNILHQSAAGWQLEKSGLRFPSALQSMGGNVAGHRDPFTRPKAWHPTDLEAFPPAGAPQILENPSNGLKSRPSTENFILEVKEKL